VAANSERPREYHPTHPVPPLISAEPNDARQAESRAVEERANYIRRAADALRADCQSAAKGNWDNWQSNTKQSREALKSRIQMLRQYSQNAGNFFPESRHEPLSALDEFPLFQAGADRSTTYLFEDDALADFRRHRSVVAARRWLGAQGIDLIFVPVPMMLEVYVEHFVKPCPPDGVINPVVRRTLLELLEADVETVDGTRLFRAVADADEREYLFNTADTHWAPRACRVMAKEVADRIARYKFGARARYGLPRYNAYPGPYNLGGHIGGIGAENVWTALTPEQQGRAEPVQTTVEPKVEDWQGLAVAINPESPVLLVGNSYIDGFRDIFVKELNMPVAVYRGGSNTTQSFADFLRTPDSLRHARVVVWVMAEQHMTNFAAMPPPIMATLD
jgi:hypothetical protein